MRLFLGAHRAGLALVRIEQPGFLLDGTAVFENADLAARLVFDGLADEGDRVHVLDLAAGAERLPRLAYRDVDVGAQIALFHVAVAGAEIAQARAQLHHIGFGLLGRANVRFGDDLHQGDAGTVEVHIGHGRAAVVQGLAGILFQMQPLDAYGDALAARKLDDHLALADDRRLVLADLVALRQIRIEIVLAVEYRAQVDLCFQPEPGANRLRHAKFIDDRQHARHRRIDQRNMAVRLAPEFRRRA